MEPSLEGTRSSDRFRADEFIISRNVRSWATGAVFGADLSEAEALWESVVLEANMIATGSFGLCSLSLSLSLSFSFSLSRSLSRMDFDRPSNPNVLVLVFRAEMSDEVSGSPEDDKERSDREGYVGGGF